MSTAAKRARSESSGQDASSQWLGALTRKSRLELLATAIGKFPAEMDPLVNDVLLTISSIRPDFLNDVQMFLDRQRAEVIDLRDDTVVLEEPPVESDNEPDTEEEDDDDVAKLDKYGWLSGVEDHALKEMVDLYLGSNLTVPFEAMHKGKKVKVLRVIGRDVLEISMGGAKFQVHCSEVEASGHAGRVLAEFMESEYTYM
eukprot:TRINITY_DN4490_c0_g1_i1.p1 TRINITY_DN4490_c0_g1~~TRINITY_DN4490_c0_g1_i1.p1  ORF type:complete len:229 (-),score=37.32 TRINITY_DN4490_c0_g1_i1:665-1264(-)